MIAGYCGNMRAFPRTNRSHEPGICPVLGVLVDGSRAIIGKLNPKGLTIDIFFLESNRQELSERGTIIRVFREGKYLGLTKATSCPCMIKKHPRRPFPETIKRKDTSVVPH